MIKLCMWLPSCLDVMPVLTRGFSKRADRGLPTFRFDQRSMVHPEDDAFTFTMKALLRNLCRRNLLEPKRCRAFSRQHSISRLSRLVTLGTEGKQTASSID